MNRSDDRIVGFDARILSVPDWLQERRDEYLLRPEVKHPFSADEMVWPSVFDEEAEGYVDLTRPAWVGRNAPLWDDLGELRACLDTAWGPSWKPCRLIAVSLVYELCSESERIEWDERLDAITSNTVTDEWEFIGYDICDRSVLSGLMNCGFMPEYENVQALRNQWAPHLNDHNLFTDVRQAAAFRLVSNQRVQEHAPFFVFGIYSFPMHKWLP